MGRVFDYSTERTVLRSIRKRVGGIDIRAGLYSDGKREILFAGEMTDDIMGYVRKNARRFFPMMGNNTTVLVMGEYNEADEVQCRDANETVRIFRTEEASPYHIGFFFRKLDHARKMSEVRAKARSLPKPAEEEFVIHSKFLRLEYYEQAKYMLKTGAGVLFRAAGERLLNKMRESPLFAQTEKEAKVIINELRGGQIRTVRQAWDFLNGKKLGYDPNELPYFLELWRAYRQSLPEKALGVLEREAVMLEIRARRVKEALITKLGE